jgi:hypothetical protein
MLVIIFCNNSYRYMPKVAFQCAAPDPCWKDDQVERVMKSNASNLSSLLQLRGEVEFEPNRGRENYREHVQNLQER